MRLKFDRARKDSQLLSSLIPVIFHEERDRIWWSLLKKSAFQGQSSKFREKQYWGFFIFNIEMALNIGANVKQFWSLPRLLGCR